MSLTNDEEPRAARINKLLPRGIEAEAEQTETMRVAETDDDLEVGLTHLIPLRAGDSEGPCS